MRPLFLTVAMLFLCTASWAAEQNVAAHLQDISVTIKSGSAEGSGVVFTCPVDGKAVNWVWTAAHVVDDLRKVEEVIDPATGTKRQKVTFADCAIVKELVENGRRVGELKMDAQVFCFSKGEDLAVLRIRKTDFVKASVAFYLDDQIPPIGTELYHVGSLLGQMGANSMTTGIVSQIGRTLEQSEYDQTTCTAFPGSSGGGAYLKDGRLIGFVTRGAGEGFNLVVPVRRVRAWAKKMNIEWAVDPSKKAPADEVLKKMPVEDAGATFAGSGPTLAPQPPVEYPTLIRRMRNERTP